MESMVRSLVALFVLLALLVGCVFLFNGRGGPPVLTIVKPDPPAVPRVPLEVPANAPRARSCTSTSCAHRR